MVVGETTPEGTSRGHTPTVFTVWGFQLPTEKNVLVFAQAESSSPFLYCVKKIHLKKLCQYK